MAPVSVAGLTQARREFHATLLGGILSRSEMGIPSNADGDSPASIAIAGAILDKLGPCRTVEKLPGQTSGAKFESVCAAFVKLSFGKLQHLRPGNFTIAKGGGIAKFEQYAHLLALSAIAKANRDLATAIGSDYLIKPDVVIGRNPEPDDVINKPEVLVDDVTGKLSGLRASNQASPSLHASISCKWTLRSDRAQNARSEGLNLVRNRKGRLPHICVIVGEPMVARIASLALGTGDIDCVYHFALTELREALVEQGREEALELLDSMVGGKRLRDIADLPLDLAI